MNPRAPKGIGVATWADALTTSKPILLTVHGTFDGNAEDTGPLWWHQESAFQQRLGERLRTDGDSPFVLPFHWTGQNSDFDRQHAARDLHKAMFRLARSGKRFAVLAHSHGGNVVSSALRNFGGTGLGNAGTLPAAIITYGTPHLRRERTLLNRLILAANVAAFVYALPLVLMMLIAAPSIFGAFGNPATEKIGPLSTQALVSLAILICLSTIYVAWRYGLAPVVSGIGFMRRRETLGARWLNLHSSFDEVITVLPKFVTGRYRVISNVAARRAVIRAAQTIAAIALTTVMGILFIFGIAYVGSDESSASEYNIFVRYSIPMFYFVLSSNFYILLYLVALTLSPLVGPVYGWLLNRTVRQALKDSAYGEDHDYHLREILPAPHDIPVIDHAMSSPGLGGLTPERRHQASSALLDFVVGGQAAEALAVDPTEVWRDLNAALFHNAYFEDEAVMDATVDHLKNHLALASPQTVDTHRPPAET